MLQHICCIFTFISCTHSRTATDATRDLAQILAHLPAVLSLCTHSSTQHRLVPLVTLQLTHSSTQHRLVPLVTLQHTLQYVLQHICRIFTFISCAHSHPATDTTRDLAQILPHLPAVAADAKGLLEGMERSLIVVLRYMLSALGFKVSGLGFRHSVHIDSCAAIYAFGFRL